ncbi:hypothetical protein AOL_s00080g432 [Orbilia oligospora ATCC 24927]|uniref:GST N-terminal domain-containing protein n=1 Tax=Arthrobotrys oligospora (strain ATCC 24927 / CBS 115.81 / DSM 1491) TaxID=756982 RepID=G1XF47_ARTOA|nr:hypothetical protein AOL_s00080g432 [Orbilia oligospora ATCC 24927]EGX48307.1 hypothetical protein AOL_s00080g432 [Orbilia oligospora ATCC 24927]
MSAPNISLTLYYHPECPFVHRVLTTLRELSLPFDTVFVDLDVPRSADYLAINPRGTVPALKFSSPDFRNGKETILTESLAIIYFLGNLFPNHLLPAAPSAGVVTAVARTSIFFFINAWENKITPLFDKVYMASFGDEKEAKEVEDMVVGAIEKEIDPLLKRQDEDGGGAFLGGREKFTMAEVVAAPVILRLFAFCDGGLLPRSFKANLLALPNFGKWASELVRNESLLRGWDEAGFVSGSRTKLQEFKEGKFRPKICTQ